jgi:hypothetical protein
MQLPDTEQVIFNPIRGFVSETDTYPIGEVRKLWDQTALSLLDSEISEYIEQSRPVIIQTCKKICEFYN